MSKASIFIDNMTWFCSTTLRLALYIVLVLVAQIISMLIMAALGLDYYIFEGTWEILYVVIAIVFVAFSYSVENGINKRDDLLRSKSMDSDEVSVVNPKRDELWCDGRTVKTSKLNFNRMLVVFLCALGLLGIVTLYLTIANKIADSFTGGVVEQALSDYDTAMDRYANVSMDEVPRWDNIIQYIALIFFVPVIEEMVFRGLVFGQYKRRMPFWAAALTSAFFFGVIHGISIQIGYALIAGVILSMIYYYCDSIYCSIVVHAIFNFFGGVCFNIGTDFPSLKEMADVVNSIVTYAEFYAIVPTLILLILLVGRGYQPLANKVVGTEDYNTNTDEE